MNSYKTKKRINKYVEGVLAEACRDIIRYGDDKEYIQTKFEILNALINNYVENAFEIEYVLDNVQTELKKGGVIND